MTVSQPREKRYGLAPWDLSELLPDPSEEVVSRSLGDLEDDIREFEDQRAALESAPDAQRLLAMVRRFEDIWEKTKVLASYGALWFASDIQSEAALTYQNRMRQTLTSLHNRILFFNLWWANLEDEQAEDLLPMGEEDSDYRFFLEDMRRFRRYTLDERSEQIINLKDADGIGAVVTLYSMLTNRFEFSLEKDGETLKLNRDQLMSHVYSPDPKLRKAVYRELYRVYEREAKLLAQMYTHRVRDWYNENVKLRGYTSPIAVRNLINNIPDEAVDSLLSVTERNSHHFHRYFRLKASWLGQKKLRRYDIYAPLTASESKVSYEEAVDVVLQTLEDFHPVFASKARRVFDQHHIDSEIRPGKRSGGFCATVAPRLTPWVLINYTGRLRDIATLAHELGHAIHSMMAEDHSVLTQGPSLPLAETASVFSEMLVTDRLLQREEDPAARRELLASALEDIFATVLRQAYFVRFEMECHEAILANRSPDEIYDLYMDNLNRQFGDSLEIAPEFRYEWLGVPHIYTTPFYCYSYSFGQLLVLALYRRYLSEGERFKPLYLKLLTYGGSASPRQILGEAGIDAGDPAFWQGGFDVVADMIAQIEELES